MLTYEEQEANRQDRLNEVGTEAPCPWCQRPRVRRSDYIRCNPCGTNWLDEEMHLPDYLSLDPRVSRSREAARIAQSAKAPSVSSEASSSAAESDAN